MAFPKKRGLRQITVDNVVYRWKYSGELQGELVIYGPQSGYRSVIVKSHQWSGLWLSPSATSKTVPEIVTPAIVRRAIEFALAKGWKPDKRGFHLTFWYSNSKFQTDEPNAQYPDELRAAQFKRDGAAS